MANTGFLRKFMEWLSSDLHLDYELGTDYLTWLKKALDHCSAKKSSSKIWSAVSSYIFASSDTQLVNARGQSSIHPIQLGGADCNSLLLNIGHDYVAHAQRFYVESEINSLLTQFFYETLILMAVLMLLITVTFMYRYYYIPKPVPLTPLEIVYSSKNRCLAVVNRDLRRVKYELQHLKVLHMMQPEELLLPDGSTTLVLKVSTHMSTIKGVVESKLINSGSLYRMYNHSKNKPEYKIETVRKIMNSVNNHSRKMRILLLFDQIDATFEDILRRDSSLNSPCRIPQPVLVATPKRSRQRCGSQPPLTRGSSTVRSTQSTRSYKSMRTNIQPRGGVFTRSVNVIETKQSPQMTSGIPRSIHRYTTKLPTYKPVKTQWKP